MRVTKDGRDWRLGTAADAAWFAGKTTSRRSVTDAVPPLFAAYATFFAPADVSVDAHERALVDTLIEHTSDQPWWLGYLDTGVYDVVFPQAPKVSLYWDWYYVLVEAGPEQALSWRTGHIRGPGALPDLFFPADHSWFVSALWDDSWTAIGGSTVLISTLLCNPLVGARRVNTDEDALPPGLSRD